MSSAQQLPAPPAPSEQSPISAATAVSPNISLFTRISKVCKRIAWRLTGFWGWLHLVGYLFTGRDFLIPLERMLGAKLLAFLASIGFAPVNASLLRPVVKIGWVLIITEFSILQVIGLCCYVFFFPITALLALLFRGVALEQTGNQAAKNEEVGKDTRATSFVLAAFAAWFLLYGASNGRLPIIAGTGIAGLLLITRIQAAMFYAQPAEKSNALFAGRWILFVINFAKQDLEKMKTTQYTSKIQAHSARRVQEFLRWPIARATLFLRGKRGEKRGTLLVLLQYVGNLLLLGLLTIVFWAMVVRFAALPRAVSFQSAFQVGASHILPGLNSVDLGLPWGLMACISATAWVLLVVYAGPAASIFPSLQASYAERTKTYFTVLKRTLHLQSSLIRALRRLEKTLN